MGIISVVLINIVELSILAGLAIHFNKWWIILLIILIGFKFEDKEE